MTADECADAEALLRQLETEIGQAREYVLRCRESGDEPAARLHVVWIDLLLEEWSRCRVSGESGAGAQA
ncbi:hypothetical protein A8924_5829 [Saccharopolyspora erythraea NRRL 2338]|nr:hypothetical protein A8924_5829 [Saccharopolyspora erythraea NRRL 2338]